MREPLLLIRDLDGVPCDSSPDEIDSVPRALLARGNNSRRFGVRPRRSGLGKHSGSGRALKGLLALDLRIYKPELADLYHLIRIKVAVDRNKFALSAIFSHLPRCPGGSLQGYRISFLYQILCF
jgi:hypothetical protein